MSFFTRDYFDSLIDYGCKECFVLINGFSEEVYAEINTLKDTFITLKIKNYQGKYFGLVDVAYAHIISVR